MRVGKVLALILAILPSQGLALNLSHTFTKKYTTSPTTDITDSLMGWGEIGLAVISTSKMFGEAAREANASVARERNRIAGKIAEEDQPGTARAMEEIEDRKAQVQRNVDDFRRARTVTPAHPVYTQNSILADEVEIRRKHFVKGMRTYRFVLRDIDGERRYGYVPKDFDEQVEARARHHRFLKSVYLFGAAYAGARALVRMKLDQANYNGGMVPLASLAYHGAKHLDVMTGGRFGLTEGDRDEGK